IFKKIFLDSPLSANKLFIIGDPKQSIYSFRNADINTYISARKMILKKTGSPKPAVLDTNFRALPGLLKQLNKLFSHGWFEEYEESLPQVDDNLRKARIIRDETGRDYCNIVQLGESPGEKIQASNAKIRFSNFIADEIRFLLANRNRLLIQIRGEMQRNLHEGDICIVVRKQKDAEFLEQILKENNIKAAIYKKAGLYQSEEAKHLKYLLSSIARPESQEAFKKALLTRFFDVKIEKLDQYCNLDYNHFISRVFKKWLTLSEKRQWPKLFESIMEDSGIVYRLVQKNLSSENDPERALTNLYHIIENLEEAAYKKNLDIYGILALLNNLIENNFDSLDHPDLHRLETEDHKVQIMTIHASKGLEFPVVFLAGGFTTNSVPAYYKFHRDGNIYFDLLKNQENKVHYENEETAEEKRLYYVAATRAVLKLYIPYFDPKIPGKAGPLGTFIRNAIDNVFPVDNFIPFKTHQNTGQKNEINRDLNNININNATISAGIQAGFDQLFSHPDRKIFENRKLTIQSFSGLSKKVHFIAADETGAADFGEDNKENDEMESAELNDSVDSDVDIHVPYGSSAGDMFHAILENINFRKAYSAESSSSLLDEKQENGKGLIDSCFNRFLYNSTPQALKGRLPAIKLKIAEIIYKTLNTPIIDENFSLSQLDDSEKLHELEFYYPVASSLEQTEVFINGFIDLVFSHQGRYYLLDWKSNYLDSYEGSSFEKAVNKHYELQYKIYYLAFIRWLEKYIENFDYSKHFGGIFYLYLRGIGSGRKGIFFNKPDENEPAQIETDISRIIKNALSG
ncbi:MAG: UvrD-helicase domain-containing protein, partial [Spirochaetes bacterium]|nr:UvrD-helicase domain-containing protein [Spirochaetota bacterium]